MKGLKTTAVNVYDNALADTDPVNHARRIYGRHYYKHGPQCMTCQCISAYVNQEIEKVRANSRNLDLITELDRS